MLCFSQILVPIANGSEEMEAVMIIDILRRAKANVVVASVEDKLEIVASRKVKLVADMLFDEAAKQPYDLIVLPVSDVPAPEIGLFVGIYASIMTCLYDIEIEYSFALVRVLTGWTWWCPSIFKLRKAGRSTEETERI